METGIGLLSAALGCGLAAAMARLAIDGLFRMTFMSWGVLGRTPQTPRSLRRSLPPNGGEFGSARRLLPETPAQGSVESTAPRPPVASRK